jgi:hypothetical protein
LGSGGDDALPGDEDGRIDGGLADGGLAITAAGGSWLGAVDAGRLSPSALGVLDSPGASVSFIPSLPLLHRIEQKQTRPLYHHPEDRLFSPRAGPDLGRVHKSP